MELRVLEYFVTVAREQNISKAAACLHLTQPTLSRQLKDLEEELNTQLFIRGNRKITLTGDGRFLFKRAEEILNLTKRTEDEIKNENNILKGEIYIGTGESASIRNLLKIAHEIQQAHSQIHFHIVSGDTADLTERLDKGLFDFCILFGPFDMTKYDFITLPYEEHWGILMRKDDLLADRQLIYPEDLYNQPLIFSRQTLENSNFVKWFGIDIDELNITGTYNLFYNAAIMAEEHMGYVITFKDLVNTEGTDLCFRDMKDIAPVPVTLVWKKYQPQTKACKHFINTLQKHISRKI